MSEQCSNFNRVSEAAWRELYAWVENQIVSGQKEYSAQQAA